MDKEEREIFGSMFGIVLKGTIFVFGYYLYKKFAVDPHIFWMYTMLIMLIALHIGLAAWLVSDRKKQKSDEAE